jgi:hypothetical protein
MLRRPSEPCSSKTFSVVSSVQRRFNRFLMLISTSVSKDFKARPGHMHFADSGIVDLSARCKHVIHGGSGPILRYTRDDLRTTLWRVVVPSSLKTTSVPNEAHRRFRRFQVFILHTSLSNSVTFILYVCYH